MSTPARSVRGRLTLAVALVVGAIALATAMIAPRVARDALVDDLLDSSPGAQSTGGDPTIGTITAALGPAELTWLFGPDLEGLANRLDDTGALDRLRQFRTDANVVVISAPGAFGVIDVDGTVRVERSVSPPGPVISRSQFEQLAVDLDPTWLARPVPGLDRVGVPPDLPLPDGLDPDVFDDPALLDEWFGEGAGASLDDLLQGAIDQGIVDTTFGETPPDLLAPEPGDATTGEVNTLDLDDIEFGTRTVDGTELIVAASTVSVDRNLDRIRNWLWAAVPTAMLLAGLATWLLAGRALRPVAEITNRAATIRAGTLHERVPVPSSGDEIAELATVVNGMLDRIETDVSRRRQFVADASHELRSPIATLRVQAEAALRDPDPDAEALANGTLIEVDRLAAIVSDLLALARHDEGLAPPGSVVDLDDVVLTEARRARRVEIDTRAVSAGRVRGRVDELTRVVTHLLDNAARHAREQVVVSLTTRRTDDGHERVELIVDDDGPGVPAADRERVFERFVRLDEARERDRGGSGLGLAVVAAVSRAAGGTVAATEGPLGGARFVISLPAAG